MRSTPINLALTLDATTSTDADVDPTSSVGTLIFAVFMNNFIVYTLINF
jgi:hypothetical protein